MSEEFLTRLRAATPELNAAAVDEEYKDPFWWDRYGERGRRFALEDGQYQALRYTEGPATGLVPEPGDRRCSDVATAFTLPADEVAHEARTLLSYLADALAFASPQIFLEHLAWRRGFDLRRARPDGFCAALLRSLTAAVPPESPAAALLARAQELPR